MESAASVAAEQEQPPREPQEPPLVLLRLEKPCLPQATVYAEQVQDEEEAVEVEEKWQNGASGVNGASEQSPPSPPPGEERSHCCEPAPTPPGEDGREQGGLITALAPAAAAALERAGPAPDQPAENHNTLGTNVVGASTAPCSGAQQIVYVRGAQTCAPEATPLGHCDNVVRIQIVPADEQEEQQQQQPAQDHSLVKDEEEQCVQCEGAEGQEDCNNNHNSSKCPAQSDRTLVRVASPDPPEPPTSTAAMVQKKRHEPADLDGAPYVYYMAARSAGGSTGGSSGGSSGQCSPSDMLDSGTCSDIELTPPPLPKKMSQRLRASSGAIKKSLADGGDVVRPAVTPPPPVSLAPPTPPLAAAPLQVSGVDNDDDNGPDSVISVAHQHEQRLQHQQQETARNRQNAEQTVDGYDTGRTAHQHAASLISATDSDGSESCLSCDSLNFEQLQSSLVVVAAAEEEGQQRVLAKRTGGGPALPDSLLAAIRGSRPKVYCTDDDADADDEPDEDEERKVARLPPPPPPATHHGGQRSGGALDLNSFASAAAAAAAVAASSTTTTRTLLMDKINSLEAGRAVRHDQPDQQPSSNLPLLHHHHHHHPINERAPSSCSASSHTAESVRSNQFESDRYYKFHLNERAAGEQQGATRPGSPDTRPGPSAGAAAADDDDESFAGLRDLSNGTSTIRSNKGTVRGVKNRVRNGIATFLQMQQTGMKNYKDKEAGKVVVYSTSMGIVRETYTKCANVKQILRTLLVKFEERDIFMSSEYQQEIRERMQSDTINIPQVFVDGQHIGDAECIERLNESGELRKMLKPYKCLESPYMCKVCGGYRLLPCPSCGGSKKSIHRNHFTAEFVALKCMNCDEVGLVKCHNC
ncbi:uncharacterized protein LOC121589481 [Anopheles merus]|uniref:uncharacterized protein LOC121589481 n=1 Tax=Anopheles merus TaxID=30066 RepID=UPI001BE3F885|nr:uncharacterized protein LOC121589481 [Anopheles merus]